MKVKSAFESTKWARPIAAFTQPAYSDSFVHVLRYKDIHLTGFGDMKDRQGIEILKQ